MGAAGMSVNCPLFKLPSPNRRTGKPVWRAAIVLGVLDPLKSAPGARERAFGVPIGAVDVRQFGGRVGGGRDSDGPGEDKLFRPF